MTWIDDLSVHGDRVALVCPDGSEVSYADLEVRVAATAEWLGPQRRLVLVAAGNFLEPLVGYLACLRGRHPVLMADQSALAALVERYDPDLVLSARDGSWYWNERRPGSAHALHPELALLLSTSGSTGSPKLVRLSRENITANADAIAAYLDIRATDRAAMSLPMHYCYGLSVVNSNLSRGAALLLCERSVTDPEFWAMLRRHGGTSLHAVPYTFELLDRVGFGSMRLPALRYVTQAGGHLDPQAVRRYAELGTRQGWRLFVMYGQTEATARMAYLPPELAARCPSAIGRPIPGGSFGLEESGELVYRGPNVMLGYAREPADLALGRTVTELRTGDLARRRPDGLYEIVGRCGRFIKPFGLRVDLDQVERLLGELGHAGAATGSDDELVIVLPRSAGAERVGARVGARVTARTGLPADRVRLVHVDELPRLANGKLDRPALAELAAARPRPRRARWRPGRASSVHAAFRTVFGERHLPDDATFVSLGGDSLSYVRMTIELQRVLGRPPERWEHVPLGQLAALPRRSGWSASETAVVLRAVAIVLVVGSHVGLFYLLGGAHLLLAVSGWAFARFVLPAGRDRPPGAAILRAAARIAVPSMLWIAGRAAVQDDVELLNALLLNQLLDPAAWGYWYVESLVQSLLLLALLFALPALDRWERAWPFWFALGLLAVALVGRLFPDTGNQFSDRLMSTHLVLWLFVLGWLVQRATTWPRRATVAALTVLLVPSFFDDPARGAIVTGGLLMLLVLPWLPVPRPLVRPLGALAGSSLAIYLTHYALYPDLLRYLPPALVVPACLGCGVALGWAYGAAARKLAAARARPPSHPVHTQRPDQEQRALSPRGAGSGRPDQHVTEDDHRGGPRHPAHDAAQQLPGQA